MEAGVSSPPSTSRLASAPPPPATPLYPLVPQLWVELALSGGPKGEESRPALESGL